MIRLAEIVVRGESTAGAFVGKLELGEGLQSFQQPMHTVSR
jgi:hypothetical protein